MNRTALYTFIYSILALGLASCAHNSERIDAQVAKEQVSKQSELRTEADVELKNANLTQEQKLKLNALKESTQKQLAAMQSESLKLRSVLIKTVLATDYKANDIRLVKKKLKKVEDKRLAVMFDAVDEANKILGRDASDREIMLSNFLNMRDSRE